MIRNGAPGFWIPRPISIRPITFKFDASGRDARSKAASGCADGWTVVAREKGLGDSSGQSEFVVGDLPRRKEPPIRRIFQASTLMSCESYALL
jgi:hypothetical protein